MPETKRHLECRTALFLVLRRAFGDSASIGSEQFVYWDPTNAKLCLAPDVFVRLGTPKPDFRIWQTWKLGAPHLAVEIASHSDVPELAWSIKLERYRASGIGEVVRFDPEDRRAMLRIWDAVDGDLVERDPEGADFNACDTLGLFWTIVSHPDFGPMLRLAHDREGRDLVPTPDEAEAAARAEKDRIEADARAEKERLEAEVAALKAKLAGASRKRTTQTKQTKRAKRT